MEHETPDRDESVEAAEATQKIHRRKVKARRETIEAMMEVPRARMKKMYAPPKIRLNRDTKSVNLVTFLMSVEGYELELYLPTRTAEMIIWMNEKRTVAESAPARTSFMVEGMVGES